jgi:LPS sulfotransferase NodH
VFTCTLSTRQRDLVLKSMKAPIFIMGTQRAGTTLLTRIMSAHPQMFVQNELELPEIFGHQRSKAELISAMEKRIFIEEGLVLKDILASQPDMLWGLKDPQLTEYIDELRAFLPDTKFIIIVRDGRGVTNSYIENKWGLGTNVYTGAQRWQREVNQQRAFMQEAPEQFLYIRYEDLVDDLEATIKQVCSHIGLPFHDDLLNYDQKQSYYQKKRENIHTDKKPQKSLAEKWRKQLTARQISVIEHVAGDTLRANNYPIVGETITLNKLQVAYYQLHQKIVGEFQIQYRWRKAKFNAYFEQRERIKKSASI